MGDDDDKASLTKSGSLPFLGASESTAPSVLLRLLGNRRLRWVVACGALFILCLVFVQQLSLIDSGRALSESSHFLASSHGSPLLSLLLTVALGILGGQGAEKLGYPSMLGMLLSGMLLRNLFPSWIVDIPHTWTSKLWTLSLAAVIARAGLSIELSMLQKNMTAVLLLGSVPILIEASVLVLLGSQLFHFPLPWVFMMAFGVASISPGVVVPLLLNLLDQPAWKRSRLPPLMLAATGVDVLIATTGFGIAFASAFQHTHEHETDFFHDSWIVRGVEEISFGLLLGLFVGAFAFVLHRVKYSEPVSTSCMFFMSSLTMGWGKTNGMTGVACSSIIISWAAVANVWDKVDADLANKRLKSIWNLFKPFLFPVIGASVSLTDLPLSMFLRCAGIVLLSVLVKALVAFFVGHVAGMDYEERLFVSGTWTGKASVQAALCNVALEMVHLRGWSGRHEEVWAKIVFMCMVAAILIGGPLAGLWVSRFGQKAVGLGKNIESPAGFLTNL